jgi:hypothetical protein
MFDASFVRVFTRTFFQLLFPELGSLLKAGEVIDPEG